MLVETTVIVLLQMMEVKGRTLYGLSSSNFLCIDDLLHTGVLSILLAGVSQPSSCTKLGMAGVGSIIERGTLLIQEILLDINQCKGDYNTLISSNIKRGLDT